MRAKVNRLQRNVTKHRGTVVKKMRLSRRISIHYTLRRSAYPHQPYVYVLPPRRRQPKLVLTGTSIVLVYLPNFPNLRVDSVRNIKLHAAASSL